jgi:hypothetical protein
VLSEQERTERMLADALKRHRQLTEVNLALRRRIEVLEMYIADREARRWRPKWRRLRMTRFPRSSPR